MEDYSYHRSNLYRRIVHAKLFIDSNFHSKINIDHIADEAYFSKFHFIRTFKEIYGCTPHQYLTEIRIKMAKRYLAEGMSVTEVCFAVGFESISAFTGLFKTKTGLPPATFKRNQQKLKREISRQPFKYIPGCHLHSFGWDEKISNFEEV